jgi:hypothetical protein
MLNTKHIGLFYSYGPHFVRSAHTLRQNHPDAHITAFVPYGFPVELLKQDDIECIPLLSEAGGAKTIRSLITIFRMIRNAGLDMFVVLFDSPKLQLLCAASNARERYCAHLDGRITPVRFTVAGSLFRTLINNIKGRTRYAYIWLYVHFTKVPMAGKPLTSAPPPDHQPSER